MVNIQNTVIDTVIIVYAFMSLSLNKQLTDYI